MPNASNAQYDFRGGEWSPLAQGRMDDPRYKTALARCLNSYPIEEGAWTRRSGTRHAAPSREGAAARLAVFNFTENQPYNIELTSGHMRFFNGRALVYDDAQSVTSISTDSPAVLTVPATTWVTDDQIYFGMGDATAANTLPLLTNRQFQVEKLTTTTFALHDAVTGAPIDGSTLGWTAGLNVQALHIKDITTPYTNGEWSSLRVVQADTSALFLSSAVKPYVLTQSTAPAGTQFATFSLDAANFVDGPYLDAVPGSTITPSATSGLITVSLSFQAHSATAVYSKGDYVLSSSIGYRSLVDANVGNTPASSPTYWVAVSPGAAVGTNGFVATDVGRHIRFRNTTAASAYSAGTTYNKGDIVTDSSIGYRSLVSGNIGHTPATSPLFWEAYTPGWTWGRITALSSTGLIAPSGYTNIGDLTAGGGLAAAFDGSISKVHALSASFSVFVAAPYGSVDKYVGKNFSSSPQAISSVIVYPTSDYGYIIPGANTAIGAAYVRLRGKATAPASASDGTLLAEQAITSGLKTPLTLVSSDATTTWNYVWVEIAATTLYLGAPSPAPTAFGGFAQAQFYSSSGLAGVGAQVQLVGPSLPNTTTMTEWRLGAYSDTTGWPTCGCYHEGRLWLGGAVKNRFDASRSNLPFDFTPTNQAGVVGDSNAISGTFNSSDINSIFWMEPDLQGIVCGTQAGEWLLQASASNNPLTPASIQAHRVTKYGCANIKPCRTGSTTMFVQKFGRRIHEYLSDIFSGRFFAPNATERAKHLTNSGVLELAYQEELVPIVWARMGDGTFAGSTYRRVSMSSSAEPVFNGWHQHVLGSDRIVESIVVGPSVDGNLDNLAMVTNDPETGIRHIEIMETMFNEEDVITDAWFLDDAVTPSAAQSITISGAPGLRFHGLWHLNGHRVTAWIGGVDAGDYLVTNGYIEVPYAGLLTKAWLTELSTSGTDFGNRAVSVDAGALTIPAVVGFTYKSQGQVVRPNDPTATGARQGPAFGKVRRGHKFAALFHNAQGVSVGTDFVSMDPVKFTTPGGTVLDKTTLFSGMLKGTLTDKGESALDGNVAWEISRPYPATIAAIGEFLSTQDE